MDSELFRWVLVGVLAIGVVALLAVLATLTGIRKALERGGDARPAAAAGTRESDAPPAEAAEPVAVVQPEPEPEPGPEPEPEPGPEPEPEPVAQAAPEPSMGYAGGAAPASAAPASAAAGAEPAPAGDEDQRAAAIRSVLAGAGVQQAEPAAAESGFAAHADQDEPEEEPFQRDGRWWFKRGTEFMVYDEASGQWQPTERPASWGAAAAASAAPAAATQGGSPAATQTDTMEPVEASPAAGSFWKCPSCGAVNGSTAATCRMCFSPRP